MYGRSPFELMQMGMFPPPFSLSAQDLKEIYKPEIAVAKYVEALCEREAAVKTREKELGAREQEFDKRVEERVALVTKELQEAREYLRKACSEEKDRYYTAQAILSYVRSQFKSAADLARLKGGRQNADLKSKFEKREF